MKSFSFIIFQFILLNQTPLCLAVKKENIEIIKILLAHKDIDVNILSILNKYFFIEFTN